MLLTYVAKIDIPTTQPGRERPAEVNSSDERFLLKKEQPKTTTPPVKNKKIIMSRIDIAVHF